VYLFLSYLCLVVHGGYVTTDSWIQSSAPLLPPTARESHTAVLNFINNTMIVFGGKDSTGALNDISSFDIANQLWTTNVPALGTWPRPRFSHSAVVSLTDKMVIFGGKNTSEYYFDDLLVLDLVQNVWLPIVVSGTPPSPRCGHTAVLDPFTNQMVVFGGLDAFGSYLQDLYFFDLTTYTWLPSPQISGTFPPGRAYHTAVVSSLDMMVIFGGTNADVLNTASCFDLPSKSWVYCGSGTGPTVYGHTAVVSPMQSMLVYAGRSSSPSDGTYYFDLLAYTWTQITPGGVSPGARYFHTSIATNFGSMVVFGGYSAANGADSNDYGLYNLVNTTLRDANDGIVLVILISLLGTLLLSICFAMDYMHEQVETEKAEMKEKAIEAFKLLPKIPLGPKAKKFFADLQVSLDPTRDP